MLSLFIIDQSLKRSEADKILTNHQEVISNVVTVTLRLQDV